MFLIQYLLLTRVKEEPKPEEEPEQENKEEEDTGNQEDDPDKEEGDIEDLEDDDEDEMDSPPSDNGDDEAGMWEETFKTHHDSKPYGAQFLFKDSDITVCIICRA